MKRASDNISGSTTTMGDRQNKRQHAEDPDSKKPPSSPKASADDKIVSKVPSETWVDEVVNPNVSSPTSSLSNISVKKKKAAKKKSKPTAKKNPTQRVTIRKIEAEDIEVKEPKKIEYTLKYRFRLQPGKPCHCCLHFTLSGEEARDPTAYRKQTLVLEADNDGRLEFKGWIDED